MSARSDTDKWASLADLLADSGGQLATDHPAFLVDRVGRNRVWKVVDRATGSTVYARQLFIVEELDVVIDGILASRNIAARYPDKFLAPEILFVERERLFLVVTEVPGETVLDLLGYAHRIDKNPLRLSSRAKTARLALDLVKEWLEAFHSSSPESVANCYDHRVGAIRERLERKLTKISSALPYADFSRLFDALRSVHVPEPAQRSSPIFGDPTLANFVFDGKRVAPVDLEDVGRGEPSRDFLVLTESIQKMQKNWRYWSFEYPKFHWPRSVPRSHQVLMEFELRLHELQQSYVGVTVRKDPALSAAIDRLVTFISEVRNGSAGSSVPDNAPR